MKRRFIFILLALFVLSLMSTVHATDNEYPIIPSIYSPEANMLQGGIIYDEEGVIHLSPNIEHPVLNTKVKEIKLPVNIIEANDSRIRSRSALANASKQFGEEYYITPIFNYISETTGKVSYGTFYGAEMDCAQMTYSTTFFARVDGKRLGLMGLVSSDAQGIDSTYQGMIGIAPEIKLTKNLALRDTIKTYIGGVPMNKNRISLIYTPSFHKYLQDLWFELGISQSVYETGETKSGIEFSTKFKL